MSVLSREPKSCLWDALRVLELRLVLLGTGVDCAAGTLDTLAAGLRQDVADAAAVADAWQVCRRNFAAVAAAAVSEDAAVLRGAAAAPGCARARQALRAQRERVTAQQARAQVTCQWMTYLSFRGAGLDGAYTAQLDALTTAHARPIVA